MLKIQNVHKSFDDNEVLKGITLNIRNGISMVIIGKSGMGKSVLFKSILGLLPIDFGDITVDGISVHETLKRSDYISKFSMLFQNSALFDSMTVVENVAFGLIEKGCSSKKAFDEAKITLSKVGLDESILNLYPCELSGGMQKRVSLARAIICKPEILLFDEPTSGLDPVTGAMIVKLIKDIIVSDKLTALTITHDMKVAKEIADDIAFLDSGKIIWQGTKKEFFMSNDKLIQDFITAQRCDF